MGKKILVGSNFIGFKNRIINGDFSVWQRMKPHAITGSLWGYGADRMLSHNGTTGTFTAHWSELDNRKSTKYTVDNSISDLSGTKNWVTLIYSFEGQELYLLAKEGKTITLSFLFNSNVTGKFSIAMQNYTNNKANESYVTYFEYANANETQRIKISIPLNHNFDPELVNDENIGLRIFICGINKWDLATNTINMWQSGNYISVPDCVNWGDSNSNFIEIAELQLEEGDIATDFEYIPYDIQLQRCMRYYENIVSTDLNRAKATASDGKNEIDYWQMVFYYKVEKRVIPTITTTFQNNIPKYNPDRINKQYVLFTNDASDNGFEVLSIKVDAEL